MKKNLLRGILTATLLTVSLAAFSNPVDVNSAKEIGKKFLINSVKAFAGKTDIECTLEYTLFNESNEPVLYVFNVDNGFVIVAAEDRISPILGYSYEGNFDANNINENAEYLLNDYKWTLDYMQTNNIEASEEVSEQWAMVKSNGRVVAEKNENTVDPLLTTTWNQGKWYNFLCPADPAGPNGHVYAGCVATAMSQVIKFWNYPAMGQGTHTYVPSGYQPQTANFGETFYNYSIMPDAVDSLTPYDQAFQVAQLMWHCGIGVNMMYSPTGSGAYSNDVPGVLINNFLYNSTTNYQSRYYNNNWDNQLRNELDQGRPLYYSGQDINGAGGHAFVCDGYDDNNMFHFNLGWSGLDNGWYPSNAINTTHGPYYFNSGQGAIFNCYPNPAYNGKAIAPSNFTVTPAENFGFSATLTWTNPSYTMNADSLTVMDIVVERDNVVIATIENVTANQELSYIDNGIEAFGAYAYSVYAVTDDGDGLPATKSAFIGPNCDITIAMHDSYGDGWNGAYIEIRNAAGGTLGTATIQSGNQNTVVFPLPIGTTKFYWHSGNWDSECSFEIYNSDNEVIYDSNGTPYSGLFLTYDNQCFTPLSGDANGDTFVNINDITTIIAFILEQNPQPFWITNADFNNDGSVNILDVIDIVNYIMSQK
jgi:hypothetical protein